MSPLQEPHADLDANLVQTSCNTSCYVPRCFTGAQVFPDAWMQTSCNTSCSPRADLSSMQTSCRFPHSKPRADLVSKPRLPTSCSDLVQTSCMTLVATSCPRDFLERVEGTHLGTDWMPIVGLFILIAPVIQLKVAFGLGVMGNFSQSWFCTLCQNYLGHLQSCYLCADLHCIT